MEKGRSGTWTEPGGAGGKAPLVNKNPSWLWFLTMISPLSLPSLIPNVGHWSSFWNSRNLCLGLWLRSWRIRAWIKLRLFRLDLTWHQYWYLVSMWYLFENYRLLARRANLENRFYWVFLSTHCVLVVSCFVSFATFSLDSVLIQVWSETSVRLLSQMMHIVPLIKSVSSHVTYEELVNLLQLHLKL